MGIRCEVVINLGEEVDELAKNLGALNEGIEEAWKRARILCVKIREIERAYELLRRQLLLPEN